MDPGHRDRPSAGAGPRHLWPWVVAAGAGAVGLVLGVAAFGRRPLTYYTGDPASVLDGGWTAGLVSNTGVLAWWTAAVACALVGALLTRRRPEGRLLLAAGALSAALALDDMFQLHEEVAPDALGIPQALATALYGLAVGAVIVAFRPQLRGLRWWPLALSLALLAASVALDDVQDVLDGGHRTAGDVAKPLGIAVWTVFWVATALALAPRPPEAASEGAQVREAALSGTGRPLP